jgi:hypothetical protein
MSKYKTETKGFLDYIHREIQRMMNYPSYSSNTRFTAITGLAFHVFPLTNVGTVLEKFPQFLNSKNRNVYSCTTTPHGCVLECIYISNHFEEYHDLKGNKKAITARIEQQYLEIFEEPIPKDFNGLEIVSTLKVAAIKYNTIFRIWNFNQHGAYELSFSCRPDDENEDNAEHYTKFQNFRYSLTV